MTPPNPARKLRFASALSTAASTEEALAEVCRDALDRLDSPPDLAVLFATHQHAGDFASLPTMACDLLGSERLIGCGAEAVAGVGLEIEEEPAICLWLANLPDSAFWPMHLRFERTPEGGVFAGWPDDLPDPWPDDSSLMLLGEPFTFPADVLLARLSEDHPETTIFGGMASGGMGPGRNRLFLGRHALDEGAAAMLLTGVRVRTVVSQGCRPVGKPFIVTRAEQNIVFELGGRPAIERLEEVYRELATRERELISRGLHLGRVVSEYQDRFEQGDFLVRNVIGADRQSGAIAIGDWVRPGQTVQFHVRDAETADGELRVLLSQVQRSEEAAPQAALLFTCNGRGTRMFPAPHHDAAAIRQSLGEIPLAGFFAQGEIGPIGGKCFLHGLTASIALFEEASNNPSTP